MRAVEHLRLVMAELMVATVRAQVMLSLLTDFEQFSLVDIRRGAGAIYVYFYAVRTISH